MQKKTKKNEDKQDNTIGKLSPWLGTELKSQYPSIPVK